MTKPEDILTAAVDAYIAALSPAAFADLTARTRDPEDTTTGGATPGVDRLARAFDKTNQ